MHALVNSPSLPSSSVGITCQVQQIQSWFQNYRLSHSFSWANTWNNLLFMLFMLNHFVCVGLKRHWFIIWHRGAVSTAISCVILLKMSTRKIALNLFTISDWVLSLAILSLAPRWRMLSDSKISHCLSDFMSHALASSLSFLTHVWDEETPSSMHAASWS